MNAAPCLPDARRTDLRRGGMRLTVWEWGHRAQPPIVCVHGWGDTGASFAFVAAHLAESFHVIAPDLRGFGASAWASDGYWFPDYLADLEVVLDHFVPDGPFVLVGHSMGGNIAGLYAGVRPERVSRLVLLEGFGMPPTRADQAPGRYRRWLDELRADNPLRDFESREALVAHLRKLAPHAPDGVLETLVELWARPVEGQRWRLKMDPAHKRVNPVLYRREEASACWAQTLAPVLLISARQSDIATRFPRFDVMTEASTRYRDARQAWVDGAGHMLHWEQPRAVAALVGAFASDV